MWAKMLMYGMFILIWFMLIKYLLEVTLTYFWLDIPNVRSNRPMLKYRVHGTNGGLHNSYIWWGCKIICISIEMGAGGGIKSLHHFYPSLSPSLPINNDLPQVPVDCHVLFFRQNLWEFQKNDTWVATSPHCFAIILISPVIESVNEKNCKSCISFIVQHNI